MQMSSPRRITVAVAAAAVLMGGLLLPAAGRTEDETEKQVVEKKIVIKNCEGDDCEEGRKVRRRIFVSEDGKLQEVGGHGHHWIAAHHGKGGFLGVRLTELTPELREHFGAPATAGVMIAEVVADTPASRAGLQVGDIVTAVGGEEVASAQALGAAIRRRGDGESVDLEIYRGAQPLTLNAQIEVREGPARQARMMMLDCEGAEDCDFDFDFDFEFDPELEGEVTSISGHACGDGPCRIEVKCDDGTCECTANGEPLDCATIPGAHRHPG